MLLVLHNIDQRVFARSECHRCQPRGVQLQFRVLLYIADHESSVISGVDGAMILALGCLLQSAPGVSLYIRS